MRPVRDTARITYGHQLLHYVLPGIVVLEAVSGARLARRLLILALADAQLGGAHAVFALGAQQRRLCRPALLLRHHLVVRVVVRHDQRQLLVPGRARRPLVSAAAGPRVLSLQGKGRAGSQDQVRRVERLVAVVGEAVDAVGNGHEPARPVRRCRIADARARGRAERLAASVVVARLVARVDGR